MYANSTELCMQGEGGIMKFYTGFLMEIKKVAQRVRIAHLSASKE